MTVAEAAGALAARGAILDVRETREESDAARLGEELPMTARGRRRQDNC
jgi:hypothetical protein